MNIHHGALAVVSAVFMSGCATIVGGSNQPLSVQTQHKGTEVAGAACKLSNSKGTWFLTSPGSVIVNRAYGDLAVNCSHEKVPPGSMLVKSTTKALAFGNIIFGGVIGVGVDVATGSAYDYPSLITLEMGLDLGMPVVAEPVKVSDTPK